MPVTKSQARLFAQLLAELEPNIRRAFMASVTDLQAGVDWQRLLSSLESGAIEQAIAALNINEAAWAEYSSAMTEAYAKSGSSTAAQLVAVGMAPIGTRFNMRNPRAENWIRRHAADRVRGFTAEQVQSAREIIVSGYAEGQHPHTIARQLRNGLGLDRPRAERLTKVSRGMQTPEGVRELVIKHADGNLSLRYKVNKATAQRILRAYRDETNVPQRERELSIRQYRDALIADRAKTIAETETANSVISARDEEWRQALESQGLSANDVIKTWRHRRGADKYHRPDHLAMSGHEVQGLDTPFEFPDGAQLQFAHDPNGGPEHIIRCGCDTEFRLNRQ